VLSTRPRVPRMRGTTNRRTPPGPVRHHPEAGRPGYATQPPNLGSAQPPSGDAHALGQIKTGLPRSLRRGDRRSEFVGRRGRHFMRQCVHLVHTRPRVRPLPDGKGPGGGARPLANARRGTSGVCGSLPRVLACSEVACVARGETPSSKRSVDLERGRAGDLELQVGDVSCPDKSTPQSGCQACQ
jgi:hypothetical protein